MFCLPKTAWPPTYASVARRPDRAAIVRRADERREASPSPYQPERLLSRPEGLADQERRITAGLQADQENGAIGHMTVRHFY